MNIKYHSSLKIFTLLLVFDLCKYQTSVIQRDRVTKSFVLWGLSRKSWKYKFIQKYTQFRLKHITSKWT